MTGVRITKLERHNGSEFFTANVTANGRTVRVDNTLGSWTHTTDPKADPGSRNVHRQEVMTVIAQILQARLRRLLKGETRANDDDEVDVETDNHKHQAAAIADRVAKAGAEAVKR